MRLPCTRSIDQLRLLDLHGREIVRVSFNGGMPTTASADVLQDKSDRYYFKAMQQLQSGQLYISELDLNAG